MDTGENQTQPLSLEAADLCLNFSSITPFNHCEHGYAIKEGIIPVISTVLSINLYNHPHLLQERNPLFPTLELMV